MFYLFCMDIQTKLWMEDAAAALRQVASLGGRQDVELPAELVTAVQRLLRSVPGEGDSYSSQLPSRHQMEFVLNSMS